MKTRIYQYFVYNKSRTLISLLVMVFAIFILLLTDSTSVALSDAKNRFDESNPLIMTIKPDRQKFLEDYPDIYEMNEDERVQLVIDNIILHKSLLNALLEIEEVKLIESYKTRTGFLTDELSLAKKEFLIDGGQSKIIDVIGISNPNLIDLYTGKSSVIEGSFISIEQIRNKEYVVVINRAFAKENDLAVGDDLEIILAIGEDPITYEIIEQNIFLEIIGIMQTEEVTSKDFLGSNVILENTIYVPEFIGVENAYEHTDAEENLLNRLFFIVEDIEEKEFVLNNQDILPSKYMVFGSNASFINRAISLIEIPKLIMDMVNIYAIVILVVIILSLELYSLNNRKNEFGILIATGHTKGELVLQLIAEKVFTMAISVLISIALSIILMPRYESLMFRLMLEDSSKMSEYYEEEQYIKDPINRYSIVDYDEVFDSLSIKLHIGSVIKVTVIVSGTLILSVLLFINKITQIKPKEIFNNL